MKLNTHNQTKYSKNFKRLINWTVISFISFTIIILTSETANAGISSFISSMFGSEQVSAKISQSHVDNSQTMSLPIAAVNIDPNPDKPFDTVPVIGGETLSADLASTNTVGNEMSTKISTYVVQSGDTISEVAKMFNVSVNTILWANELTSKSVLKQGQTLIILPVTGVKYTIKKNDTILGIANKNCADAEEIYSYNDLDSSSKLIVGQSIIIPVAEACPTAIPVQTSKTRVVYEPVIGNVKGLPTYSNYYSCPVAGGRLSQELHGRNAIDLAIPVGTPIRSSASGTIIISKSNGAWNGGYGNYVVVSHPNGTQTLYGHMTRTATNTGEYVTKGSVIGYSGNTGNSTGPHLHFEIRGAQNPFAYTGCK